MNRVIQEAIALARKAFNSEKSNEKKLTVSGEEQLIDVPDLIIKPSDGCSGLLKQSRTCSIFYSAVSELTASKFLLGEGPATRLLQIVQ